jgi:methylenetetrahydrofolate reductase (NADPH)
MAQIEPLERTDLLDGYSFEITAKDIARLEGVAPLVPPGTIVSITYLPTETDEARIAAAREVRRLGLVPMPHVAARRVVAAPALAYFLERLRQHGVDRLFIVAGDLAEPLGPYPDTLSLIEGADLAGHGFRTVGVAGHPEAHPQVPRDVMDAALAAKLARLANQGLAGEIMTQFAFAADPLVNWLEGLRRQGLRNPVRLGLPGPANVGTLLRFAARCGVGASAKVMAKYGASLTRLLSTAGPDRLYAELADRLPRDGGPVSIHLYPFGGLEKMAAWARDHAAR